MADEQDSVKTNVPEGVVRLRDQHGALTRRTILQAARKVFSRAGYGPTSVRRLAKEAGVAVQTLYDTFGSKAAVLAGLLDLIDEEAGVYDLVAERDRAEDAHTVIELAARLDRRIFEQSGDILRLMKNNAIAQAEVSSAYDEATRRHRFGVEWTVKKIQELGELRKELSVERATDICEVLLSHETAHQLVGQRHWSWDEYEAWVTETLVTLLLEA